MAGGRIVGRRPVAVKDAATEQAITAVRDSITDVSVLEGIRQIDDVQLTSGQTKRIAHGLGRKLRGWIVVRTNTAAALGYIYDEQSTAADTDVYLRLRAEGFSPKISLLVF